MSWFNKKKKVEKKQEEVDKLITLKSIKFVNDLLTVIDETGNIYAKTGVQSDDIFKYIIEENNKIYISDNTLNEDFHQRKMVNVNKIKEIPSIHFREGSAYFNHIPDRSIPELLLKKLQEVNHESEEFTSLQKFWEWCCLNPNAQSAEDLYGFLEKHNFKIDKHGCFYAYRRVVRVKNENKDLIDFISNVYVKVKAVWKKKPLNFNVYKKNDGFSITDMTKVKTKIESEPVGNLEDLYNSLPSLQGNRFTSKHTGTEDYRIGEVISMPRYEGDDDNSISCSKGFHVSSKEYDYSGFGDTPILVIVNPMDVLAVPKGEIGKLRTCRWFFATTLPESEKYILDEESFDVAELGDRFNEICLSNIEENVRQGFAEEIQRHTFQLPTLDNAQLSKIANSLKERVV